MGFVMSSALSAVMSSVKGGGGDDAVSTRMQGARAMSKYGDAKIPIPRLEKSSTVAHKAKIPRIDFRKRTGQEGEGEYDTALASEFIKAMSEDDKYLRATKLARINAERDTSLKA